MFQAGNFSSYKAICCDSDEKIQITLSAQNIFHNVWKILDTQPERYFDDSKATIDLSKGPVPD